MQEAQAAATEESAGVFGNREIGMPKTTDLESQIVELVVHGGR